MLITGQIPICDARVFAPVGTGRLAVPAWPWPEPGKQFVRCFGPVQRRLRGAHDYWPDELYFASARRGLRYQRLETHRLGGVLGLRSAYRRLLANGLGVVRLDVGVSHNQPIADLSETTVLEILRDFLDLPMHVQRMCAPATPCTLLTAGSHAARLYVEATSSVSNASTQLVHAARPIVLLQYTQGEVAALPKHASCVTADASGQPQLSFLWMSHRDRELGIWFLRDEATHRGGVRDLRLGLLRLHVEQQVLKHTLTLLAQGVLEYAPRSDGSERFDEYLNRTTRLLAKHTKQGTALERIRREMLAYEAITEKAERGLLREKLKLIRRQIRRKVEEQALTSGLASQGPVWYVSDADALVRFVAVDDEHLRNDLYVMRKQLGRGFAEVLADGNFELLCQTAYETIRAHDWLYDLEPGFPDYSRQRIRTPREMNADRVGTCLDFACLFAAILESMQANPVIVALSGTAGSHALGGCWLRNRPAQPLVRGTKQVLEALSRGDLLLFEATGACRSGKSVAGEPRQADGMLTFDAARTAAKELMHRGDLQVDFLLDVLLARLMCNAPDCGYR